LIRAAFVVAKRSDARAKCGHRSRAFKATRCAVADEIFDATVRQRAGNCEGDGRIIKQQNFAAARVHREVGDGIRRRQTRAVRADSADRDQVIATRINPARQ
jgi:hypothetical protein